MRIIIPEEIDKMLLEQEPYLQYVPGKGLVLVDDAPPEIVKSREIVMKWFDDHAES